MSPERKISNHKILKAGIISVAGLISADSHSHEQTPLPFRQHVNRELSSEKNPPDRIEIGNITIETQNGIPIRYLRDEEPKRTFDTNTVHHLREKAINNKSPIHLATILANRQIPEEDIKLFNYNPSNPKEHKPIDDLPPDTLSLEELEKRGVTIIQPKTTKLSIRSRAFEKNELLSPFNNTGQKLIIALVDGPRISPPLMEDPKYNSVRHLLPPSEIEKFKIFEIGRISAIISARQSILEQNQSKSGNKYDQLENEILLLNGHLQRISNFKTKEDLIEYSLAIHPHGIYFSPRISRLENTAVIFLAAGEKQTKNNTAINLGINSKGELITTSLSSLGSYDLRPKPEQSHPGPQDFPRNPIATPLNPYSYPYGYQTPGQGLRHELAHHQYMFQTKPPYNGEYLVDEHAMQTIHRANDLWKKSHKSDDSLYYFIFSLPDGRLILTENHNNNYASDPIPGKHA